MLTSKTFDWVNQKVSAVLPAVAGVAAGTAIARLWTVRLGADQAWCAYVASLLLRGFTLTGPRLAEINPPFVFWMMEIPEWFAQQLHTSQVSALRCFIIVVLLGMGIWSVAIYSKINPRYYLLTWWTFVFSLIFLGGFAVNPVELGQREHLLAFLFLPYLLLAAMRIQRQPVPLGHKGAIGLCAATALSLKPQHLIAFILVELLVLIRVRGPKRWADFSTLTCVLALIGYVCAIFIISPTYIKTVIPLIRDLYWGFDSPWPAVLRSSRRVVAIAVLGATISFSQRQSKFAALKSVLVVASLGAFLAFVQQHKGWSYQLLPLRFFSYLLLLLAISDWVEERRTQPIARFVRRVSISPSLVVAAVALSASFSYSIKRHPFVIEEPGPERTLSALYAAYPPHTAVSLLSIDSIEFPSVFEQNKIWASRYMHLWMLPALVKSNDPQDELARNRLSNDRSEELSRALRTNVAKDLATDQPSVIAVDPCGRIMNLCPALLREGYRGVLDWLKADKAFQKEWSHYVYLRSEDGLEIYVRKV